MAVGPRTGGHHPRDILHSHGRLHLNWCAKCAEKRQLANHPRIAGRTSGEHIYTVYSKEFPTGSKDFLQEKELPQLIELIFERCQSAVWGQRPPPRVGSSPARIGEQQRGYRWLGALCAESPTARGFETGAPPVYHLCHSCGV